MDYLTKQNKNEVFYAPCNDRQDPKFYNETNCYTRQSMIETKKYDRISTIFTQRGTLKITT